MIYEERNLKAIANLGDKTKIMAMDWYNFCKENKIEILITETIRSIETQKANVAKGASETMHSFHLVGMAIDYVPVSADGKVDYSAYQKAPYDKALAYAEKIGFGWGGRWKTLVDKPHLENRNLPYGTDTFLTKGKLPAPKPVVKPVAKPVVKVAPKVAVKAAATVTPSIKQVGTVQIVGVKAACFIMDKPNGHNIGTAKLGAKLPISGSVKDYFEVIYQGKRAYISDQFGKKI